MSELERLLHDIEIKTGIAVRLSAGGGKEISFPVDLYGKEVTLYTDEGESAERTSRLLKYFLESRSGEELPERRQHLKNILLGEGGSWNAFRFSTKYGVPSVPCYCLDVLPDKRLSETAQLLERCLEGSQYLLSEMDENRIAVVKFIEEGETPYEFGQFLSRSLYEELGIRASVGIGCEMKSFSEIATSYHQAATAVRMSVIFGEKGEVHSYREYLLVKMLEDVPEARLKEYLEQFRIEHADELFEDEEMSGTAEEFLRSSLNLSETSRNLFMHRNTLTYRLDKIERITGLDIRKFSDAVTFRVISILYRLLNK